MRHILEPTIKYTPEEFHQKVLDFFEFCKQSGDIPTKVGLLIFLDVSEETVQTWKARRKNRYLKEINFAHRRISHFHLQRFLKSNPNNSAWYLERAFVKEYSLTHKLDVKTDGSNPPVIINLTNKGKNKC